MTRVTELTTQDFLRNVPPSEYKPDLSYNSGRVCALSPRTRDFITSPNCEYVPLPPLGSTRDLYRRADGFYGHDDPVCWPQPFNKNNPYLSCIPRRPTQLLHQYYSYACMWEEVSTQSLDYDNLNDPTVGTLSTVTASLYEDAMNNVRARTKPYLQSPTTDSQVLSLLREWDKTMTVCHTRLSSESMDLRDIRRGVSELKRSWVYSVALLDYIEVFSRRVLRDEDKLDAESSNRMGCFVWNAQDALALFDIGLPVFFVRPYSAFSHQVILRIVEFTTPNDHRVCSATATPPYDVLLASSQAGSDDKFAAIREASVNCYTGPSPFANIHIPGAYKSSYVPGSSRITSPANSLPSLPSMAGPSRTKPTSGSTISPYHHRGKKHRVNPPLTHRNRYEDVKHLQLAPVFSPWADTVAGIDTGHPSRKYGTGTFPKLMTIVPDPALIFSNEKQNQLLQQWAVLRQPWLTYCREHHDQLEPVHNAVWRRALTLDLASIENVVSTKNDINSARSLVLKLLPDPASRSNPLPIMEPGQAQKLSQELSIFNLRFQLSCLDSQADQHTPKASAKLTQAELRVALANHRRERSELIHRVLYPNGGDTFGSDEDTFRGGFVDERWSDRVNALRAFATLMEAWPGDKPGMWQRGQDPNLPHLVHAGMEWEKELIRFYVQTYFNFFGHPPVVPRRQC
ncbi:hypothetical protein V5O48_008205 [Marasmius crinis-equi]|uniref:Uncharacterized protein n=1 Tax=Marasmius crinis-equi TaxID=585013 RepID=A0ABR3FES1_9AGAR